MIAGTGLDLLQHWAICRQQVRSLKLPSYLNVLIQIRSLLLYVSQCQIQYEALFMITKLQCTKTASSARVRTKTGSFLRLAPFLETGSIFGASLHGNIKFEIVMPIA